MDNCIFCKIIKGEIKSAKIWEDDRFIAILDVNPNTKGMTLVLTKEHFDSYAFAMPDEKYSEFMLAAKKVARLLEKGLGVKRVVMVMEGLEINHAHIKLYPVYPEEYSSHTITQTGENVDLEKLEQLAEEIKSKN